MKPTVPPLASVLLASAFLAAPAGAQVAWSVDWQGPTIARPDSASGVPITEADLLLAPGGMPAFGPLPPPTILRTGGDLGLAQYANCVGHQPGTPCGIEIDALSEGAEPRLQPPAPESLPLRPAPEWWFSVDEYAVGVQIGGPPHPTVATEALVGDSSCDVFARVFLPPGPLGPMGAAPANAGTVDGNGLASAAGFQYVGTGLVEPNPPTTTLPNPGDNLDALDIGASIGFPALGQFFSLDASFPDPLSGLPNSGSAAVAGFAAADVLRTPAAGVAPSVYAPAALLGLDQMGTGTDDLDALVLADNGDGFFQRSLVPYDWADGSRDMLLFSVRRGSAVVGKPDSIFGIPIEPGDVLTTPRMPGMSTFPGIFIAAETLGLATVRSGTAALFGDDLDALDLTMEACFDCNKNGVEDSVDIANGFSSDANGNGIPDECEGAEFASYCACPPGYETCGNPDPAAGCRNSTGQGGRLTWSGTSSVADDDLKVVLSQLPTFQFGLVYMGGDVAGVPFGDGMRCVGPGASGVFRFPFGTSGPSGSLTLGPGVAGTSCANLPPAACIQPGQTWRFQGWYRDPSGPCASANNLTNALSVTFTP